MNHVNNCFLSVQICISRWKAIICLFSLYTNSWYIFLTVSFSSVDGCIRICCWEPFINALYGWHIWMPVEAGKTECSLISLFLVFIVFCVCENCSLDWDHFRFTWFFLKFILRHWFPLFSLCRTESDLKFYGSVQVLWRKMGYYGEKWI